MSCSDVLHNQRHTVDSYNESFSDNFFGRFRPVRSRKCLELNFGKCHVKRHGKYHQSQACFQWIWRHNMQTTGPHFHPSIMDVHAVVMFAKYVLSVSACHSKAIFHQHGNQTCNISEHVGAMVPRLGFSTDSFTASLEAMEVRTPRGKRHCTTLLSLVATS